MNEEPKAWMLEIQTHGGDTAWILSWTRSGAGLCNRLQGETHEIPLYAHPNPDEKAAEVSRLKAAIKRAHAACADPTRPRQAVGEMLAAWIDG